MTEDESKARQRFIVISAVRLSGVAMILLGIAFVREVLPVSPWVGYVLIVLGMVEAFLMPVVLARKWTSPPE